MTDCKWEDLGIGNLKILQDKNGYLFTSDAVILANFVSAKPTDKIVEFGSGSGIISILLDYKEKPESILGFEVQKSAFDRANLSIKTNGQEDKIKFVNDTLLNAKNYVKDKIDIVVCNPPYKKLNGGSLPKNKEVSISKVEVKISLNEIIITAKKILKSNGKFYICQSPNRIAELIYKLKKNGFEPKKMFFSYPSVSKKPSCVFLECVLGANEEVKVLPPLITHNDEGDYVTIIRELFKKEK